MSVIRSSRELNQTVNLLLAVLEDHRDVHSITLIEVRDPVHADLGIEIIGPGKRVHRVLLEIEAIDASTEDGAR